VTVLILSADQVYRVAAHIFVNAAKEAIEEREVFSVALSGGSTPKPLYSLLAGNYREPVPWDKTHVFFADERCVPSDHPSSNFRMIQETLLSKTPMPQENIHRMKGEIDPGLAAEEYGRDLSDFFRLGTNEFPRFDLILLGMGEDGHTASLFPESEALDEESSPVAAPYVTKLNSHRLTLTPPVLKRARQVVVLVTGENKAQAVRQVLEGPYEPRDNPAQLLRHAEGDVTWILNEDAGSRID
jgi:6-phosphogluconolactonase